MNAVTEHELLQSRCCLLPSSLRTSAALLPKDLDYFFFEYTHSCMVTLEVTALWKEEVCHSHVGTRLNNGRLMKYLLHVLLQVGDTKIQRGPSRNK